MPRRLISLVAILAIGLVVACGGGGDDNGDATAAATATTAPDSTTSTSGGSSSSAASGSRDSFCTPDYADAIFNDFNPLTAGAGLKDQVQNMGDLLDRWANDAPSEIRDDVRVIVDAMKGFFAVLEENDYDFLAAATSAANDPRFAALDSDAFNAAVDHLNAYCGYNIDTSSSTDSGATPAATTDTTGGSFAMGELPEGFPEALIPPDSTIGVSGDFGVGTGAQFSSTASISDVVDFYKSSLGAPTVSSGGSTLWSIIDGNKATSVAVSGTDGDVEVIVTISNP